MNQENASVTKALDCDGRVPSVSLHTQSLRLLAPLLLLLMGHPPAHADTCLFAPPGLVAWFPAEGVPLDIVGGVSATDAQQLGYAYGKVGGAFDFTGEPGAAAQIPWSSALDLGANDTFTVEFWFYSSDYNGFRPIIEWGNLLQVGFSLWLDGGFVRFTMSDFAGNVDDVLLNDYFPLWQWMHLALTYDRTSGTLRLFRDGVQRDVRVFGAKRPATSIPVWLGRRPSIPADSPIYGSRFIGRLDELSFYNRALTTNEISAIHAAGTSGKCFGSGRPVLVIQPRSQAVATGGNVGLALLASGSELIHYTWFRNGFQIFGPTNRIFQLADTPKSWAGTYTVIASNAFGVTNSQPATLAVLDAVTIQGGPYSQRVLAGTTVSFSALHAGDGPVAFQWLRNASPLAGATNSTLWLTNAQGSDEAIFAVTITNPVSRVTSAGASLIVDVPPGISNSTPAISIAAGENVSFTPVASGEPPLGYQWFLNGAPLPGAAGSSLLRTNVQPVSDAGIYTLMVTNPYGVASNDTILTVTNVKPTLTLQPVSRTVAGGASATFSTAVKGSLPFAFQWWHDGTPIPGAVATALTVPYARVQDAGEYRATVSNPFGVSTSAVARLSVHVHPDLLWVRSGGSARADAGQAVALSPQGQLHLAGFVASNATFGSVNLTATNNTNQVFLAAYAVDGELLDLLPVPGPQADQANALVVDAGGNRIVAGQFRGLLDFGVTNLASAGSNDAFVAKLAPNGTALWAHRFGGPRDDIARGVAVDVQGNIFVTGYFQGTNAIGGTNLVSASTTRDDIFLARFSAGGDLVWAQRTGGTNGDRGTAVAVDAAGHILLTGSFSNTVAFGWTNLVASNNSDAFLARYTPEGEVTWAVKLPDRSQDGGLGVAVDSEGNTFVTGEFGRDYGAMRLAKYGPDAQLLWITNVGVSCCTGDYARGNAVAVDPAGNAYVAGYVSSSITIAGVSLSRGGFAAGFSKHGPALWARKIGKEPMSVAVDAATNVYLSGTFTNTFNFGTGIVSNVVSRGNDDVFLARLALRAPQWTDPPVSQIAPDGVPLTLFAGAVGSGGVRYQWQFNGMNLPGATNSTLTLGNLAPSNAGYYSLILTNPLQTLTNSPVAISSWRFGWQASSALFEIGGPIGKPYRLEYRDFMAESNWTTLSDFSLSTNPTYLPDPTSAQATNRIYRLLQLP